ncbi:MAG: DUF2157 domain-containing protein [Gammaproteobacteria bacterium]
MSERDDALLEIAAIAKRHGITADDIATALNLSATPNETASSGILSRLFGYIGGILIFSGIGAFITLYWDDFGSAARIIATWGVGLCAFYMAVVCLSDRRFEHAVTPLFLIALLLQPAGILVMLDEFSGGGDPRYGLLFMAAYMLLQQGLTFWGQSRSVLAFGAIWFGCVFFATVFDLWDFDENLSAAVIGVSLLCLAYALGRSPHAAIAPFWYLAGAATLLWAVFDAVKNTPFELLYLGLAVLLIFLSTVVRSRTLLTVATLAMLVYIGYYTAEHFAESIGWPVTLVVIGAALIGCSVLAVKLNRKYITNA